MSPDVRSCQTPPYACPAPTQRYRGAAHWFGVTAPVLAGNDIILSVGRSKPAETGAVTHLHPDEQQPAGARGPGAS